MSLSRMLLPLALLIGGAAQAATVTLLPGQTARLGEKTVTLLRVQDSRCPMNARCIRAGELLASVLVRDGQHVHFLKLQWPELPHATATGPALRVTGAPSRMTGDRSPLPVTVSDEPR